jgi:hypothetical protein
MGDKEKNYLNKVVDFMFSDTEINTERGWFNPPYLSRTEVSRGSFKNVYLHTFGHTLDTFYSGLDRHLIYFTPYVKNVFGLTDDESEIVWEMYMDKLNTVGGFNY